jgi:hypothetical protein
VCLASVVVTPTLDWKLHGLDVLSEFDGGNPAATGPMLQYDWLVGTQYKALELGKSDWATIRKSPPWALDSWGLGRYSSSTSCFLSFFLRMWVCFKDVIPPFPSASAQNRGHSFPC